MDRGLLSEDHVFIDSTHVKASAIKRKYGKKIARKETRANEEKLQEELNLDREENGKKPFPPEKYVMK
ncbi:transposase [Psychrobacillus sp. FJAT-21963]|nr:transposase [Psychrobacillus sp. FJAT-21963]